MFTTGHIDAHTFRTRKTLPLGKMLKTVLGIPAQLATNVAKRREIAALGRMDEWQLKDIGLTRADVEFALQQSAQKDPAYALQKLTSERRAADRAMARENLLGFQAERLAATRYN